MDSIFDAVKNGSEAQVRRLLDINALDKEGWNALSLACLRGNIGIVKLLLQRNADVGSPNHDGSTPLHQACLLKSNKNGDLIISEEPQQCPRPMPCLLQLLLDHRAQVNAQDWHGCTPLHYAVDVCNLAAITLLLTNGADVNAVDNDGDTPLHCLTWRSSQSRNTNEADDDDDDDDYNSTFQAVSLLLKHGAKVNKANFSGRQPLHSFVAIGSGECDTEALRLLIDKGANLDAPDDQGHTPLHLALIGGHEPQMAWAEALLKQGANPRALTNDGKTPLDLAIEKQIQADFFDLCLKYCNRARLFDTKIQKAAQQALVCAASTSVTLKQERAQLEREKAALMASQKRAQVVHDQEKAELQQELARLREQLGRDALGSKRRRVSMTKK